MTGTAAVLVRSPVPDRKLSTLRFIRTRPDELLAVIVLADGTVENRFVHVDPAPPDRELERVHNMLLEVVEGRTLAGVRDFFASELDLQRSELHALRQVGVTLIDAAIDATDRCPQVIIEGQARLLDRPEFDTAEHLRYLLRAFEERQSLVLLLDRVIETDRVQVLLGGELEQSVGVAISMIAAPYKEDGRRAGTVGVIGPVAMNFPAVIPLVGATAEAMSAALSRSRS
jgi:heat-inducible transcriptional repressor